MTGAQTLVLSRSDIAALATPGDYVGAAAEGFRLYAEGQTRTPAPVELSAAGGAFHIKSAVTQGGVAAVKVNGNFPDNPARRGLPTIQGMLMLLDAETGSPLAIMESGEVTLRRTAAASALAVDLLASHAAATLFIWGCGVQGRAHAEAIAPLRRFQRLLFYDIDSPKAARLVREFGPAATTISDPAHAAFESEVIITTTTAHTPLAFPKALRPGAVVVAVGADNPHKNEIPPALMARSAVVTDVTDQCAVMGDLRAAIAANAMSHMDVRAELGDIVAGRTPGRLRENEIMIFDSTGAAFQDLAAATMIYERATSAGIGAWMDLKR